MVERFIRTLREECLDLFWFKDPEDLQRRLSGYQQQYNVERYHSALGITPAQRAEQEQDRARIAEEKV